MSGKDRGRSDSAGSLFVHLPNLGESHGEVNLQIIPQTAEDEHKTHDLRSINYYADIHSGKLPASSVEPNLTTLCAVSWCVAALPQRRKRAGRNGRLARFD
jgi:hypothetical protein